MDLDAKEKMETIRRLAKEMPPDAFAIVTSEDGHIHPGFSFLTHMMDQYQASLSEFTEYERGVFVTMAIIDATIRGQLSMSPVAQHPSMRAMMDEVGQWITQLATVGAAAALRVQVQVNE